MSIRIVPDYFDAKAVEEIDRRLASIASDHRVTIAWAIESGSRAWGFPSPDSDYDARFIFVRSIDQYLSPWQPRDVIEMPIEGDMDVNGWDLGKAIKLMLKGNAVVLEWLQSPITYCGDPIFRDEMLLLAEQCADRISAMRHYFHLGTLQWERFGGFGEGAPLKKLFYSARPALCLRWLRVHSDRSIPPMHFQTLLRESETPPAIAEQFEQLVAAKAKTRELGNAPVPDDIRNFINGEYQLAQDALSAKNRPQSQENVERANAVFYETVRRYSTDSTTSLPT
jgi:uncharacterized protein